MIVPTPLGRSNRKIHSSCHYRDKDFSFSRGNWGPEREGPSSASLSQVSHGDPTESEEVTLITICPVLSPWAPSCSHVQKFWTFYLHSTRLPVTYSKNSQWGYEAIPAYTPTDGHPKLDIPLPRTLCQPPAVPGWYIAFSGLSGLLDVSRDLKILGQRILKLCLHLPFIKKKNKENKMRKYLMPQDCTLTND